MNEKGTELMQEGAKSYPEALTALMEFRRQIQAICRAEVDKSLSEQSDALGVKLTPKMVTDYAEPDNLSTRWFDGKFAAIGVQIAPKNREERLYYYLEWWWDDAVRAVLSVSVCLYFTNTERAQAALERVANRASKGWNWGVDKRNLYVSRDLDPADISGLGPVLEKAIAEWNRAWRMVGGLSAVSGRQRRARP